MTDEYTFTSNGFSCTLRCGTESIFWQGDDASEIIRLVERDGHIILPQIWDECSYIATEDEQ